MILADGLNRPIETKLSDHWFGLQRPITLPSMSANQARVPIGTAIASARVSLASMEARFIVGREIQIDGGMGNS